MKVAFNVQELAKATGMSTDQIYALIHSKELRARKVGARWIIPTAAVHDFLGDPKPADQEVADRPALAN